MLSLASGSRSVLEFSDRVDPRPRRRLDLLVVNWQDRENPRAGGAEVHLHALFGRLVARGHRVTLLTSGWPRAPRTAVLDGIEVHRVGTRHTFPALAPLYFRRHLRHRQFDLVIEDLNKAPLFTPSWTGRPVVLLVHHLFGALAFQSAPLPVALACWTLERRLPAAYRDVPVVAVSSSTAEELGRAGLGGASGVVVIPNGIDIDPPPPDEALRENVPTVLYLGRLQNYKGIDVAIRAVDLLRRTGLEVSFWIAGEGPAEVGLRRLVTNLGLGALVTFLGRVDEPSKRELMRRAWVHLLPSRKEGWGLTVIEAAAYGTPTIASSVPGLWESVIHRDTGLLVTPWDVTAWAEAIRLLIDDRALAARMGARARLHARAFDWTAITDAWEDYLGRMVSTSRG